MQKRTRSLLEELDSLHRDKFGDRDQALMLESRANHVIVSAIRIIEQIEKVYSPERAENLTRKLLNSIRDRDPAKFSKTIRRAR
jgi:hypothetical protein